MNLTTDEQKIVVSELERFYGSEPIIYLKFTREESWAQDIVDGKLFSHPIQYFRDLEINSGEHGQGDKYELVSNFKIEKMYMEDAETGKLFMSFLNGGKAEFRFQSDDKKALVSFVGFRISDLRFESFDENRVSFVLPFTEEEYETMVEKFGSYCAVIKGLEFRNRLEEYSQSNNVAYVLDQIKYCPQNTIERMKAFGSSSIDRFLYKDEDFSYQRECRLVFDMDSPSENFVSIGDCSDFAGILKKESLQELRFSFYYERKID